MGGMTPGRDETPTPGRIAAPNLDNRMHDDDEPGPVSELTLAQILAEFRKLKVALDFKERTGTVNFLSYAHPRQLAAHTFWPLYLGDQATGINMTDYVRQGYLFVWVAVYKTTNITNSEVDLFKDSMNIAKEDALIKEFNTDNYRTAPPPGEGKVFIVACKGKKARSRLLAKKVWTIRTKAKARTFFLQTDNTWGTHVIVDIHNGSANFECDVLPKLYGCMGGAILHKETKRKDTKVFRDLAYYQVQLGDKAHKGATRIIWRVRFKCTAKADLNSWAPPWTLVKGPCGAIK